VDFRRQKIDIFCIKKMYEIKFGMRALEEWSKLERVIKERIWNKLQDCKENPFRFVEHLEEIDGFKLRVGEYRVIVDIDNLLKIIWVLKVGHRKNIYER
jgi:mRNA interferase RelE/StbE